MFIQAWYLCRPKSVFINSKDNNGNILLEDGINSSEWYEYHIYMTNVSTKYHRIAVCEMLLMTNNNN